MEPGHTWEGMGVGGFPSKSRAGERRAMGVSTLMAGRCDEGRAEGTRGSGRRFLAGGFVRRINVLRFFFQICVF